MIVLFTDFGLNGPYIGQLESVIYQQHTQAKVVSLFADAPTFNPKAAAYLLAAYSQSFPADTVFLCVVDPGVGNPNRRPIILRTDNKYFVGPDNGLFAALLIRAKTENSIRAKTENSIRAKTENCEAWEIVWRPQGISNSFHGRDLFAPVAAALSSNTLPHSWKKAISLPNTEGCSADLFEVVYCDQYGNAITGVRASVLSENKNININGVLFTYARTFSEVDIGCGFWYKNSNGLIEISVNQGSAVKKYKLKIGDGLSIAD